MKSKGLSAFPILLILAGLAGAPAISPGTEIGVGPRVGLSVDPDQVVFGGQIAFQDLGIEALPALRFAPNLIVGLGDDIRTIRISADLHYPVALGDASGLEVYPILGLSIANFDLDLEGFCDRPGADCSNTEAGLNLGGGVGYGPFGIDAILGIGDIPDLSLTVSYSFGL